MVMADALHQARTCYERQSWREARDLLSQADREESLVAQDLYRLAASTYMLGDESTATDILARAHNKFLAEGDPDQAAMCAYVIGFELLSKGQAAHGGGWLARARRVLDDAGKDSAVRGYLLLPEGVRAAREGNASRAYDLFDEALAIGRRFNDTDLVAFGRMGQGRALIKMGRLSEGIALLDEVMVAVTAGDLLPTSIGNIYCSVIDACAEIFDMRRAHEWTAALERWCERQPEHLPYRGACLVRRAEILQLHGAWADAMGQAERACEQLLLPPPKPAAGTAYYQRGELHRLRGELDKAEEAYRQASELGRRPQPGLALLRLAQGDADAALGAIRRCVDEAREVNVRSRMLGAFVEILLATNDTAAARSAADELRGIAAKLDAPLLRAMSAQCDGAILVAEGDAERALGILQGAIQLWRDVEAPYEEGRTRVLIAIASRMLGDEDTASLELDSARRIFQRLGAVTEVARVNDLTSHSTSKSATHLTARELEVLGLVATGKTNRGIADELGLSEKTVARHIANIFTKLGLSSRAAATAYAYRNRLV
jgi:ATP/maltotriose-dependent transcriptional regulator MalT